MRSMIVATLGLLSLVFSVAASPAIAQQAPPPCESVVRNTVPSETVPPTCLADHPVDSGSRSNAEGSDLSVYDTEITASRAVPWIQVRFAAETRLAMGSLIRLTSVASPQFVVELRARDLHWLDGVGYLVPHGFPGDRVRLELIAAAGSTGNRVTIDHVVLGGHNQELEDRLQRSAQRSICDATDDRAGFSQPAVARLLTANRGGGCSGFIVDCPDDAGDKCMLSAGHCFVPGVGSHQVSAIVEFDVPLSNANCSINMPADPNKTFMVDPTSFPQNAVNGGRGRDWAVFRVFRNPAGRSAFEEQNQSALPLANATPVPGSTVEVIGYGVDAGNATPCSFPSCTNQGQDNQVSQIATGPLVSVVDHLIEHRADTCGANSGSPIIDQGTGRVIGIHTHAGCNAAGGSNGGTALTLAALDQALGQCKQARGLVLLDRTGSMGVTRPSTGNSRCKDALDLAKQDVDAFFTAMPASALLAVWTFADAAPTQLTAGFVGRADAQAALTGLTPEGCSGSTPLADALCDAGDALRAASQPLNQRILAVSSDGGENNSSGACAGPSSASGPPFDPGSWQQLVTDQLRTQTVTEARFWGSVNRTFDIETGRAVAGVSDALFFENLAMVTGGGFVAVGDDDPLPPPFFGGGSGVLAIPTLGGLGLLVIALALALAGVAVLRGRA